MPGRASIVVCCLLAFAPAAHAATGDLLVADGIYDNIADPNAYTGALLRIPAAGGAVQRVTATNAGIYPHDIAYEASGQLVASEYGTVVRIDPTTGVVDSTPVASGGELQNLAAIVVRADGHVVVDDQGNAGDTADGQIIDINPDTHDQTIVTQGGYLVTPVGMAIAPGGDIYVVDAGSQNVPPRLIRIDSAGNQHLVVEGSPLVAPDDIAIGGDGSLLISDYSAGGYPGALVDIDPSAANPPQVLSFAGTDMGLVTALTLTSDGTPIVAGTDVTNNKRSVWRVTSLAPMHLSRLATDMASPGGIVVEPPAPDALITGGPNGATNDTTPTFTFTSPGATFTCALDAGAPAACSSPFTAPTPLDPGAHSFHLTATRLGKTTSIDRDFSVDLTPPDTAITAPASGALLNTRTPQLTFTSPDPDAAFRCTIDGGQPVSCAAPWTTPVELADGQHTITVAAVDPAGNVDPSPDAVTFSVDATAPETTIDGPDGRTNDTTPTYTFGSDTPGVGYSCAIDGPPTGTSCSTPFTTPALADGQHSVQVAAVDGAANVDPTPAGMSFVVDTTPPDTTFSDGPTGRTADDTPAFAFAATDLPAGAQTLAYACRLDDAPLATCTSGTPLPHLADGPHTLAVVATDEAGNTEAAADAATRTFVVDTTPPDSAIASGPDGTTTTATPTFTMTATDQPGPATDETLTFTCSIDGAAFTACASPLTTAPLANGSHTLRVRAIDGAGNVEPEAGASSRTFDVAVPQPSPSGTQTTPAPTVTATVGGPPEIPLPVLRAAAKRTRGSLLSGGLRIGVTCPAACTVTAALTLRGTTLAAGRTTLAAGGGKLTLKTTKAGRKALARRASRRTATLIVTAAGQTLRQPVTLTG